MILHKDKSYECTEAEFEEHMEEVEKVNSLLRKAPIFWGLSQALAE